MQSEFHTFPVRFILAIALLNVALIGCSSKKPSVEMPPTEARFIATINSFTSQYGSAVNPLQRGSLRTARRVQLAQVCGDSVITGWVGSLKEITTTPTGDAAIAIQLPDSNIVLRTLSSSFADVNSKTMITKDSPLHDRVTALSKGDMIKFDGKFLFGSDYLKDLSTSERDSMTKPEFLVQFKDISPKR